MKNLFLLFLILLTSIIAKAQISSAQSGNWNEASTWVGGAIPGELSDAIIAAEHTVTFDVDANVNNITVQGTLQFNESTAVAVVVNGNISVESGAVFKVQPRSVGSSLIHNLNLKGNLTHNGSVLDFRAGSAGSTLGAVNLELSGAGNSTITINGDYSTTNGNINGVTINKTGGAKVILGSDIIIDRGSTSEPLAQPVLTFQSGLVETSDYSLVAPTTTAANISDPVPSSYVFGSFGRGMAASAGVSRTFFIGDENNYRPVSVQSTAGAGTGHYVKVGIINGDANTGLSAFTGGIDKVSFVRYYKVTYIKGTTGAASMSFNKFTLSYGEDDGVNAGNNSLRIAYSLDDRATWNGINQTVDHITDLSNPPASIVSDMLSQPLELNDGQSLYLALARVAGSDDNPLPVELVSFGAQVNNNIVELNWSTATETNNKGFEIHRKNSEGTNGNSGWEEIGFVVGFGTTTESKVYSFKDDLSFVPGKVFTGEYNYRLKQIDYGGTFKYSDDVKVVFNNIPNEAALYQNYPNPFNPETNIKFELSASSMVNISVYNLLGEKVETIINEFFEAGVYTYKFNGNRLSNGTYFYILSAGNVSVAKKLILLK